jgi:hypothetical protein
LADLRANRMRPVERQSNRKIHLDEGTCDYWTAVMLGRPDIFDAHRRGLGAEHPRNRSLAGARSGRDFDGGRNADPHYNGTLWAALLWDLRQSWSSDDPSGRGADRLVLAALAVLGRIGAAGRGRALRSIAIRQKRELRHGIAALLEADHELHGGRQRDRILRTAAGRQLDPDWRDRDYARRGRQARRGTERA